MKKGSVSDAVRQHSEGTILNDENYPKILQNSSSFMSKEHPYKIECGVNVRSMNYSRTKI